jgi:tRNA(Ile)-lysidine synthetase-like protein
LIYWVLARYQKNTDNINFSMVEDILQFTKGSSRSHKFKPVSDLQIYMHRGIIYFLPTQSETESTKYPVCMPLLIDQVQEKYVLSENWELCIDQVENTGSVDFLNVQEYECWLDADKIVWPLELRPGNPGERIVLLGLAGHSKKINDYLTDRHIPAQFRKSWPVLCSGGQVIWAAGSQPAETVCVSPLTKKIIHLLIQKVDDED